MEFVSKNHPSIFETEEIILFQTGWERFFLRIYSNKTCSRVDHKVIHQNRVLLAFHFVEFHAMTTFCMVICTACKSKNFQGLARFKIHLCYHEGRIFFFPIPRNFFTGVNAGKPSQLDRMIGNFCKINIFLQI